MLDTLFDPLLPPGEQANWHAEFRPELSDVVIGAAQRVSQEEAAYPYRDVNVSIVIAGMWESPADNEASTQWVKDCYQALHPHGARLARIKAKCDPSNPFHINQNIQPVA
ncbi:BBE domain-containing protein [Arthrobacter sp. HLT1-20]